MRLWWSAPKARRAAAAKAGGKNCHSLPFLLGLVLIITVGLCAPAAWAQPTYVGASSAAIATLSNNTGTLLIGKHPDVTAGDMMLVQIALQGGSGVAFNAPGGWALAAGASSVTSGSGVNSPRQVLYYKVATSAEVVPYTFTYDRGSARVAAAVNVAYRGVKTDAPLVTGQNSARVGNQITTAPITAAVAGSRVIYFYAQVKGSGINLTPSIGTTELVAKVGTGSVNDGVTIYSTYQTELTSGAVSGATVSTTDSSSQAVSQTVVLEPATSSVSEAPSGFNAVDTTTPSGIGGNIQTKVAGQSFNLDLIAINRAGTGVLTSYTGSVAVDLMDATNSSGAVVSGSNCLSSWTVIGSLSSNQVFATGNSGRMTFSGIVVGNAYRNVRIRITGGTTVGCSTDAFAIRPSRFSSPVATDADWLTTGITRRLDNASSSGGAVHAAGAPFQITAEAVNELGARTPGYNGSPTLVFSACVVPSPCAAGVFAKLTGSFSSSGGVATATNAAFGDAGVISLNIEDLSFTDIDSADGSTRAQRLIASPFVTVGRFVPRRYQLALANVPQFLPAQAVGCTTRADWNFTWIGQPFSWATPPSMTVTAQDANGNPLLHYAGALFKLTPAAVSQSWMSNAPAGVSFSDPTGQTATLTEGTLGVSTYALGGAASFQFARPTAPVSPFNAVIKLTLNIADATEIAFTGNGTIAASAALVIDGNPLGSGSGIEFQGTNAAGANLQLYGRLQLAGANGDSRRPLSLVYETQAWSGEAWYRNQRDSCFSPAAPSVVALSNWTGGSPTCYAAVSAVTQATRGQGVVKLTVPQDARSTGTTATMRLGTASGTTCVGATPTSAPATSAPATSAGASWLQGPWTSATDLYNTDPTARATWGRVRNDILMRREQ